MPGLSPEKFRAPYITIEQIRSEADSFRQQYWPSNNIPIEIFEILEFDLNIEIRDIFNLKETCDVDALLLANLKTIIIDRNDFLNDSAQNRLRFSIAHEIGHLVLHSKVFTDIKCSTVEEWIQFFHQIPEDQYRWIENHANEFAGRILVPREQLLEKLNDAVSVAETKGYDSWDTSGESTLEYLSNGIAREFEVSGQVIEKRLVREKLWPISQNKR